LQPTPALLQFLAAAAMLLSSATASRCSLRLKLPTVIGSIYAAAGCRMTSCYQALQSAQMAQFMGSEWAMQGVALSLLQNLALPIALDGVQRLTAPLLTRANLSRVSAQLPAL